MTESKILSNKKEFIDLVNSIEREGFYKDKLLYKLENSDFYTAPASTFYHNSVEGGLVEHSLNVYHELVKLVKANDITEFSDDTLKIVALFHDLSKMNFYELYHRNVKKYSPNGNKSDDIGKFSWESEKAYKVRDVQDRYLFGTHGQNSERILSYYMPLSEEESVAIIWHHAGMDNGMADKDITPILNRYKLAVLLHIADLYSCYVTEHVEESVKIF